MRRARSGSTGFEGKSSGKGRRARAASIRRQCLMDDAISYGVGAVHGGDGDGAKPVVRESFERRGKTIDGAVVAHHAVTVEGTEGEADAERRQDAVLIETRCLHVAQCFRFQHLPTRTAPPVEEHGDETGNTRPSYVHMNPLARPPASCGAGS